MAIYPTKPYDTKALLETSIDLSQARDTASIAEILFDFIEDIVAINMAVLYTIEEDGQTLRPIACRGSNIENLQKRELFKLGEGGVGYVGREKRALLLTDAQKTTNLPIKIRQVTGEDPSIRSFLSVPLIVDNRLAGVLSVSSSKPNRYTMHDVEIVSIVANQVAALMALYQQIEDAQRFSDHILENINSGVLVTDNAGSIIMVNRTGEEIIGRKQRSIRGRSILRLRLLERETRDRIRECLADTQSLLETPGIFLLPKSEKRIVRISSSRLLTTTGKAKGFIFIFRDVTRLEQLQDRLSRYERLAVLGKWTSSISHEIRNSLLPIRSALQLLNARMRRYGPIDEESEELMAVMSAESDRINNYLNQLADSNRSAINTHDRALLSVALEETIALVQAKLKERSIRLECPDGADLVLPFSKDQIIEMFLNLFLNSIDALEGCEESRDRFIRIGIRRGTEGETTVDFEDNGEGIRKEDQCNIFEPFFTTKAKGTGLGLFNIHSLMTSAGGEIKIRSEVGKGTIVTLDFNPPRKCL